MITLPVLFLTTLITSTLCFVATPPLDARHHTAASRATFLIAIITLITCLLTGALQIKATSHGMYNNNMPINEIIDYTIHTPSDESDKLTNDLTSTLIYVYRFDCDDCKDIHDTLTDTLSDTPHLSISSRNPTAQIFIADKNITSVPSVIAIDQNANIETFNIFNENSRTLNYDNLERAIDFSRS